MSIKVNKNLVSSSKHYIKCPNFMDAEWITYHNTANDATAENEIKYMISNNNQVSYHFAVDDKEVWQGVPTNRNAWHCGDGSGSNSGNRTSIGVEVCFSKSGGSKYYAAEKLANKFIAQLLHERGWGVDRVRTHQSWSGKNCPHRILDAGLWNEILRDIQNELDKLNGTKTSSAPKQQVKSETVEKKPSQPKWTKVSGNWKGQTLKPGQFGKPVEQLQSMLSKNDPPFYPNKGAKNNGIDSYYGDDTTDCVKRYQSYYGLTVDGLAGKQVYGKLTGGKSPSKTKSSKTKAKTTGSAIVPYPGHLIKVGSRGKDVERIQRAVGAKVDGIYGQGTKAKVEAYQRRHGLAVDGIVGRNTWNKMF